MRRACRRGGTGARRRSRGSARAPSGRSSQRLLVRPRHPAGEGLLVLALVEEAAYDCLDIVGQAFRRHLVGAELAAEPGLESETATEVDLEALDLVAVVVENQLALEPDVGDLDPGARVGTAVDVDADRGVEVGDALLELG